MRGAAIIYAHGGVALLRMNALGIGSCLVAGLCHDVGHPGRNNNFFVSEMSALVRSAVRITKSFIGILSIR